MTTPLLLAAAVAAAAAGLLWPFLAAGFLVAGAIPFYALYHLLDVPVSGEMTAAVFGSLGIAVLLRLAGRGRITDWRALTAALFFAFALLWYLRWFQEPPTGPTDFGGRAVFFMGVFALVPFGVGLVVGDVADVRRLLASLAAWGALAIAVIGVYYVTRRPSHSPIYGRWVPIPGMGSIPMSLEIGMGTLALTAVLGARRGAIATYCKIGVLAAGAGLVAAIGERGPFVFLVLAAIAQALLEPGRSLARRVLLLAGLFGGIAVVAFSMEGDAAARVLSAQSYTAESNVDRLGLLKFAYTMIPRRPFTGWGGGLVGLSAGGETWIYIHETMLDPLVETGIFGALLIWILFGLVLWRAGRVGLGDGAAATAVRMLAPLFAYVFLEYQVSSHISMAKHMWFLLGLLVVLGDGANPASPRPAGVDLGPRA